MNNLFTVDVEDYFQVNNLSGTVERISWDMQESRVVKNTHEIVALLARHKVKATFFVLGWVAERFPRLVKEIQAEGHEVASHGFSHERVCDQTPEVFRHDLRQSKQLLESLTGEKVLGYRAPTYSITKDNEWALDILIEEGFVYDSSFFPFRYQSNGLPKTKRYPHSIERKGKTLWEFPVSGLDLAGTNLPFSGGGYFRLCPYSLVKHGIKAINSTGNPAMVYIHPWEIDPGQPRFRLPPLASFRHYYGLARTEKKLERLLADAKFMSIRDFMEDMNGPVSVRTKGDETSSRK